MMLRARWPVGNRFVRLSKGLGRTGSSGYPSGLWAVVGKFLLSISVHKLRQARQAGAHTRTFVFHGIFSGFFGRPKWAGRSPPWLKLFVLFPAS